MSVEIFLTRHGKTMFNTLGRAQGWSDSPLTKAGEAGIIELGRGFRALGITFDAAYTSDTGRTLQTKDLILQYADNLEIPQTYDKRLREWCFGSYDGGYDGDLFDGVLPRVFAEEGKNVWEQPLEEIHRAIYRLDTAGWAETWEALRDRILGILHEIAEKAEQENHTRILVVSHGMTIATVCYLLRPNEPRPRGLDNGSVTHLVYENGQFTVGKVGDMSYREAGRKEHK
ncbi:MAG: phosphoglycerate mutase family protein [Streptococcaceae bacterium]|jgi:probable phosphoglycerate mutase|nr:phosphoglycerate mutase family protein [Streptococcaceae bacterium]